MSEHEALVFVRQALSALVVLHDKGIAHRDLRLDNLRIDYHKNVRLIEFGNCFYRSHNKDEYARDRAGEKAYAAPEVTREGECKYSPDKADVLSLGMCLVGLLVDDREQQKAENGLSKDAAATMMLTTDLVAKMSPSVRKVLDGMLCMDTAERTTARDAHTLVEVALIDCKVGPMLWDDASPSVDGNSPKIRG